MDGFTGSWLDEELTGCDLPDKRLSKRLRKLLAQVGGAMGQSIPFACQDWSNAKAAYRFLSNDRVSEADILAGHFESTRGRAGAGHVASLYGWATARGQRGSRRHAAISRRGSTPGGHELHIR